MNILVIGGTRFFGIPMVEKLIENGHQVTLATRGMTPDSFGNRVDRIKLNIYDEKSVESALSGKKFDAVIDKMGYGSKDVRSILENVETNYFVHMSTAGVYELDHMEIMENEFDASQEELIWCSRGDVDYDTAKRQAECVLCKKYGNIKWTVVRSPFVIGVHDYTKRLFFYVNHIMREQPIWIDNLDSRLSFAEEQELGEFFAYLISHPIYGAVNVSLSGTVSVREIVAYIEEKTQKKAIITSIGEAAPYNGAKNHSLNLDKLCNEGAYCVSDAHQKVYEMIDTYILDIQRNISND